MITSEQDWTYISRSAEETEALGRALGERLRGGEVIALHGDLGAGKTCFAGGVAEGMGIAEPAVSPTYIIMRSYPSPRGLTLHHIDFYRLDSDEDAEGMGAEECEGPESVVLVEWPERCPETFAERTMDINISVTGGDERRIEGRYSKEAEVFSDWPPPSS